MMTMRARTGTALNDADLIHARASRRVFQNARPVGFSPNPVNIPRFRSAYQIRTDQPRTTTVSALIAGRPDPARP